MLYSFRPLTSLATSYEATAKEHSCNENPAQFAVCSLLYMRPCLDIRSMGAVVLPMRAATVLTLVMLHTFQPSCSRFR